jgi:hypothetical protein
MPAKLRIEDVTLRFTPRSGNAVTALDGISLEVAETSSPSSSARRAAASRACCAWSPG